ncbi:MAG: MupG family TIM beta-alpha barrel fold protein [Fusobacteria bacterium]|nr:MupG family TIM beta-alpha barrel fold protein [Fusobacteriota bacterium]
MRRLGISVYPQYETIEKWKDYISQAAKLGFSHIFTCLLSLENEADILKFKSIMRHARTLGFTVLADVSPSVLHRYNLTYKELKFFEELGVTGIRLDEGFSGFEESIMSCNPYGLTVDINLSGGSKVIERLLEFQPNLSQISVTHNFYPMPYSGLSREHALQTLKTAKKNGISTSVFVNAKSAKYGPWPLSNGLCTLEMHRDLDIMTQVKDWFNTNLVDTVIIANAFASSEELESVSIVSKGILELRLECEKLPKIYEKILFEELHFHRGDISEYLIRSTQSRVKYKGENFPLINVRDIEVGDVLIHSSENSRYAGEMNIALKPMKNSGAISIVGNIASEELFLLLQIKPWQKFILKK